MKKKKLVLGIVGALMMFVCSFFLAFYTIRDYYVARNGTRVQGRVVNNSGVCKRWNKTLAVEYAAQQFDIRVYGRECRLKEFEANQPVNLRSTGNGDFVVLESNNYTARLWFMIPIFLLSVIVNILMFKQYSFWKRAGRPA